MFCDVESERQRAGVVCEDIVEARVRGRDGGVTEDESEQASTGVEAEDAMPCLLWVRLWCCCVREDDG